jgi:beta-glucoside operon transcriptional antiterminator
VKIHKVLNNNVAFVLDENGNDIIYVGKGIAFQKKPGDELDESLIDKKFYMADATINDRFQQILMDIPMQHIELASDAVEYAKVSTGKSFSDTIYISLSDHIYTAIQRFLDGVSIKNPMRWEIQRFYEPEYEVGLKVLDMVEERFKIRLPEDEASSIAVHLVNASMASDSLEDVYEVTKVITDISNIVRYFFSVEFDTKSVYYYRFITHIRFFAQRLVLKQLYDGNSDDSLFEILKTQYLNSYQCILKIEQYILKNYNYKISNDEKLYLMIHVERIVYKIKD